VFPDATGVEYAVGFHHIRTERPVALAVTADRVELVVPRLETDRVDGLRAGPRIDAVHRYFDYPGGRSMETVAGMLEGSGPRRSPPTPTALRT
jgi:hypothetical protein